jgi:AcrR family transcriptional regulator
VTVTAEERPARKPRADARRNRERLVDAAKAAFAEGGAEVSLEEIARRARVGIGTLYRHFPSRDAVLAAVYRREVQQMADAADRLLTSEAPAEALHEWMRLFVDYIATKKVIAPALGSFAGGAAGISAASGLSIVDAVTRLVERARAAGDIRPDTDPADIGRALIGFTYGNAGAGWEASALRLIDILMDGLRTPRRGG